VDLISLFGLSRLRATESYFSRDDLKREGELIVINRSGIENSSAGHNISLFIR